MKTSINAGVVKMVDKFSTLVDLNEASSELLKFIGTDKCNEIISSIQDNARSGFIAGMSFALCFIMANCKTYVGRIEKQ